MALDLKSPLFRAAVSGRRPGAPSAPAEPDDMFSALEVRADGWTMSATILNAKVGGTYSGLNDYANPAIVLDVSSQSYDATGAQTTISRSVVATAYLRQEYPNGTLREETTSGSDFTTVYSLSERIYSGDTINSATIAAAAFTDNGSGGSLASNSGGVNSVTNSSGLAYPLPQAVWLTPPLERATSSSWAPRLLVMHRYARNGTPVRAVKFSATDGTNTVTSTVTALTTGQYSASGLYANWYQPSWNLSTLTNGVLITIDATIYPWVGDEFQLSVDGDTYETSANITVLKALYDGTGAFGTIYAYVDGVGGGTPAANTNAATAAANPFASISAAATAAITLNNSTYSRNNLSGVTIRIPAATTITGLGADTMDGLAEGDLPLLIEGVNQSTSIYENAATNTNNDIPGKIKWKNLTMRRHATGGSIIGFQGKNNVANAFICEDVIFSDNGAGVYSGWLYRVGRQYFVNCSGNRAGQGQLLSTNTQGTALVVGSTFVPVGLYNSVACKELGISTTNGITPHTATPVLGNYSGCVVAFNHVGVSGVSSIGIYIGETNYGAKGISVVGNIVEGYGALSSSAMYFSADTDVTQITNAIEAMNTVVGERTNIAYQDTGTSLVLKEIVSKHSIHYRWNLKSDYFTTSGNTIGNWATRHGVDGGYSLIINGSSDTEIAPDYNHWLGEALGDSKNEFPRGTLGPGTADFVNDNSNTGSDDGNGDYSLGGSTTAPQIPAGMTMFAVDLLGHAIPTDGTARAGARQSGD